MSVSLEDILIVHKIARKIAGYSDKQAEKEIGEHIDIKPENYSDNLLPRSHSEAPN